MRSKALVVAAVILAEAVAFVFAARLINPFLVILGVMVMSGVGLWMAKRKGPSLVGESVNEFTSSLLVGESLDGTDANNKGRAALSDKTLQLAGIAMLVIPGIVTGVIGALLMVNPIRALLIPVVGNKVNALFPDDAVGGMFGPSFRTFLGGIDPTFRRQDVVDVSSVKKDPGQGSTSETPARPELK